MFQSCQPTPPHHDTTKTKRIPSTYRSSPGSHGGRTASGSLSQLSTTPSVYNSMFPPSPLIPAVRQTSAAAAISFSMKILPPTNQPSWHEKRKRPVCPPCCLFPCKVSENIAKIASSRYMILHIDTSSTRPSTKERVNSAKTVLYAL